MALRAHSVALESTKNLIYLGLRDSLSSIRKLAAVRTAVISAWKTEQFGGSKVLPELYCLKPSYTTNPDPVPSPSSFEPSVYTFIWLGLENFRSPEKLSRMTEYPRGGAVLLRRSVCNSMLWSSAAVFQCSLCDVECRIVCDLPLHPSSASPGWRTSVLTEFFQRNRWDGRIPITTAIPLVGVDCRHVVIAIIATLSRRRSCRRDCSDILRMSGHKTMS